MRKYFYYAEVDNQRISGFLIEEDNTDSETAYNSLIEQLSEKFNGEPIIKSFNLV